MQDRPRGKQEEENPKRPRDFPKEEEEDQTQRLVKINPNPTKMRKARYIRNPIQFIAKEMKMMKL